MRPIFLAICLIALSTEGALAHQSAGEQWEQALLSAKRHGTLAGPRPGQVQTARRLPLVYAVKVELDADRALDRSAARGEEGLKQR
jgi:hypothetical protein